VIADLHREKKTVREIADAIGRSPATVSRELRRNADQHGRYLPHTADRLAADRKRQRRLLVDEDLRAVVSELLDKRWSPERSRTSCSTRDRRGSTRRRTRPELVIRVVARRRIGLAISANTR
jgi:IS30 family transposase